MHIMSHLSLTHPGWCHYSVLKTAPITGLNTCSLTLCNFIFSLSDSVIDICTGGNKTENVKVLVTAWEVWRAGWQCLCNWSQNHSCGLSCSQCLLGLGWVWGHLSQHLVWLSAGSQVLQTTFIDSSEIPACCRTWVGMWRVSPWELAVDGALQCICRDRWRELKCSLLTLLSDFHDSCSLGDWLFPHAVTSRDVTSSVPPVPNSRTGQWDLFHGLFAETEFTRWITVIFLPV